MFPVARINRRKEDLERTSRGTASALGRQQEELELTPSATARRYLLSTDTGVDIAKRRSPKTSIAVKKTKFRRLTYKEYQKTFAKHITTQTVRGKGYYGTVRGVGFDQLHWIGELSPTEREKIEHGCGDVLQTLGYPLRYPEESLENR